MRFFEIEVRLFAKKFVIFYTYVPGGALEEVVALAIHQLATESRHLVLHLSHLGIEALAYVGELGVNYAEVAELNGNVTLDTTVSHVFARGAHFSVSCH